MSELILFHGWIDVVRTVLTGILGYAALILLLRISGKRTLSKMNAFDLVVTVALGSSLATLLLNKDVSLAEGVTAFATLIGAQYLITWASIRSARFRKIIKSEPALLFHRGRFLNGNLHAERVTHAEVLAAIRDQGILNLDSVEAVILETDGSFTSVQCPREGKAARITSLEPFSDQMQEPEAQERPGPHARP